MWRKDSSLCSAKKSLCLASTQRDSVRCATGSVLPGSVVASKRAATTRNRRSSWHRSRARACRFGASLFTITHTYSTQHLLYTVGWDHSALASDSRSVLLKKTPLAQTPAQQHKPFTEHLLYTVGWVLAHHHHPTQGFDATPDGSLEAGIGSLRAIVSKRVAGRRLGRQLRSLVGRREDC